MTPSVEVWVAWWYDAEDFNGGCEVFRTEAEAGIYVNRMQREHGHGDRLATSVAKRYVMMPELKKEPA
jgi:hypothetical protein